MKLVQDAIEQLTSEKEKLEAAIQALRHLNNFADANLGNGTKRPAKKRFSAAARAKMRAAQIARWSAWRKKHGKK